MTKTLKEKTEEILARAFRGLHHLPYPIKEKNGHFETNILDGISTFDYDTLTRLVVMAHDECARVQIRFSGPRMLKIIISDRRRDGDFCDRHPTIEDAITDIRKGTR